jgi:hypothetical protein
MDGQSEEKQSKDFITWDDLATQKLSEPVNNDLKRLPIQEAKLWLMRWTRCYTEYSGKVRKLGPDEL